jgi:hypothetical protein
VQPVQAAGVLGDRAAPRDRQRQEQRVQTRVVESLADVLACRQDDSGLVARNGSEPVAERLPLLLAHARPQHDQVAHALGEALLQSVEVIVSLREHERRPSRVDRLEDVGTDALVARLIDHQLLMQRLELHPLVRIGAPVPAGTPLAERGRSVQTVALPPARVHSRDAAPGRTA